MDPPGADPALPNFSEDAHRTAAEVGPLGKSHGLVESTLLRLVIRDEYRLAYVVVSLFDPFEEGTPYACSLKVRMNQNVLEIADRCIVGNRPGKSDEFAAFIPGGYDKRRTFDRLEEQIRAVGVGRPANRVVERKDLGIGDGCGCRQREWWHWASLARRSIGRARKPLLTLSIFSSYPRDPSRYLSRRAFGIRGDWEISVAVFE